MNKRSDTWRAEADLKFDTEKIKARVNENLNAISAERKVFMKHRILKGAVLAAAIAIVLSVSVFAMTPAGQEAISSILTYFQNHNAKELTNAEELEKYGTEIGESDTKDGYTLTLDSVAADDNFIHVFYTLKSEKPFYEGEMPISTAMARAIANHELYVECLIGGKRAEIRNNNNHYDNYFVDEYTYKAAFKYNTAVDDVPEKFTVELFAEKYPEGNPVIAKITLENRGLTESEKKELWYVSAEIDKSAAKVKTTVKELNAFLPWSGVTAEKVIFSPFGNQIVLTLPASDGSYSAEKMALYDENGVSFDITNADFRYKFNSTSKNTVEFLKGDKSIKQLKFVPVELEEYDSIGMISQKIGDFPMRYKVSDYGSVVVTDIRVSDGQIEIDYYKDGFVMYDPCFELTDDNGENAGPGAESGACCARYDEVHHDTNSYTARYVYDRHDENDKYIPPDERESAAALKERVTRLGVMEQQYVKLDFDNAVTVDLAP